MSRLVIFTRFYPPFKGGAEIQTSRLALALAEQGVEVLVLTGQGPGADPIHPRLHVRRLNCNHIRGLGTLIYCFKAFFLGLGFRPTAVLPVLVSDTVLIAWLVSCLRRAKRFYRLAGAGATGDLAVSGRSQRRQLIYRRLLRKFHLVAISSELRHESLTAGWASAKVYLIPNGVLMPDAAATHDGQKTILCLGRLSPEKGFDLAIQAFAASGLASEGWRLRICGEGGERQALEKMAGSLLNAGIEMPGNIDELSDEWARCSIFLLPSRFEGMSNALLEAMAAARPVISTRVSGVEDLLADGESGLLVKSEDVAALKTGLQKLAASQELRRRLGAASFVAARTRVDVKITAMAWRQLIDAS